MKAAGTMCKFMHLDNASFWVHCCRARRGNIQTRAKLSFLKGGFNYVEAEEWDGPLFSLVGMVGHSGISAGYRDGGLQYWPVRRILHLDTFPDLWGDGTNVLNQTIRQLTLHSDGTATEETTGADIMLSGGTTRHGLATGDAVPTGCWSSR